MIALIIPLNNFFMLNTNHNRAREWGKTLMEIPIMAHYPKIAAKYHTENQKTQDNKNTNPCLMLIN